MGKYIQIMKATWAQYTTYRVSFILWRVRQVMQILVVYFLWWAIFSGHQSLFGYTEKMILTYVLLSSVIRSLVLNTTTMEIGNYINEGDLSNYLIRPVNIFRIFMARDAADKILNLIFSVVEMGLLFILLRPEIFIQSNPVILLFTVLAIAAGMFMYFNFSLIFGLLGFWVPDVWAPRFLALVILEFFSGALFPLDILPKPLYLISQNLPFFYFIYFPLKIYQGQLNIIFVVSGFAVAIFWIAVLGLLVKFMWVKGLRIYSAEGR